MQGKLYFKDISFQDKTTVTDKTIISSQSDSLDIRSCSFTFSHPSSGSFYASCAHLFIGVGTSFSFPEATSPATLLLDCGGGIHGSHNLTLSEVTIYNANLKVANLPPSSNLALLSTQITSGNVMIIGPATNVNIKMEGTSLTDKRVLIVDHPDSSGTVVYHGVWLESPPFAGIRGWTSDNPKWQWWIQGCDLTFHQLAGFEKMTGDWTRLSHNF
ncbi:hypothetical protein QOT17_021388 [Balamuthia mandrillaris]